MPVTINGTSGVVTPGATVGSITGILKATSGVISQAVSGTDFSSVIQGAKAWVNFNGTTSPPTIRSSYNVSSITKNGIGDYTVNFTTAMADANYSVNITCGGTSKEASGCRLSDDSTPRTTSLFRAITFNTANVTATDLPQINIAIFGN